MRISVFKAAPCNSEPLIEAAKNHKITLVEAPMCASTASLATGADVICLVGRIRLDAEVLRAIARAGAKVVLCDSPDHETVDVATADELSVAVIDVSRDAPPLSSEPCLAMAHAIGRLLRDAGHQLVPNRMANGAERQRTFGMVDTDSARLGSSPSTRPGGVLVGD